MPSIDLMVHTAYSHYQGLSFRKIESFFGIPKTTVHRWYSYYSEYFKTTNNADKIIEIITEQKEKNKVNRNLINTNITILKYIRRSLSIQPFQFIHTLQAKIIKKFNICLTVKMISRYIKLIKFSKKKATRRFYNIKNIKDHKLNRKKFYIKVRDLIKNGKRIICLDESGINRNIYSSYGYSRLGKRLTAYYYMKNLVHKNHSLLMAIDVDSIIKHTIQSTSFNGETFTKFVQELIHEQKLNDTYFFFFF